MQNFGVRRPVGALLFRYTRYLLSTAHVLLDKKRRRVATLQSALSDDLVTFLPLIYFSKLNGHSFFA
jgi:hypothetical protein